VPEIAATLTPTAAINVSLAWLVVAVLPVVAVPAVPVLPVPVAVLSNGLTETKPATDKALAALGAALAEKVIVMVSLTSNAAVTGAEKISILTTVPLAMVTSWV
jgi:hypothetical protein